MQRPNIVVIGGTEDQPLKCVYCGAEGAEALETFHAAANDGRNELVRLFIYPDYSRMATPKRDGVEPAEIIEDEADDAPTAEAHAAAQASIKDLFAQLEAERRKNEEGGHSYKAALTRISKLEGTIEKMAKAMKPVASAEPTAKTE